MIRPGRLILPGFLFVFTNHCTLNRIAGGRAPTCLEPVRGGGFMSDYEMLMLILTIGLVIIGIAGLVNKKQPSCTLECRRLF